MASTYALGACMGTGIALLLLGLVAVANGLEAGAFLVIPGIALLVASLALLRRPRSIQAQ